MTVTGSAREGGRGRGGSHASRGGPSATEDDDTEEQDPDFEVEELTDDTEEEEEEEEDDDDEDDAEPDPVQRYLYNGPEELRAVEDLPDEPDEGEWHTSDDEDERDVSDEDEGLLGASVSAGPPASASIVESSPAPAAAAGLGVHAGLGGTGDAGRRQAVGIGSEDEAISRRTRARISFAEVPIEELEQLLNEPDMEENLKGSDEYNRFLEFFTGGMDLPEDEDDDEDFYVDLDELMDEENMRGPGRPKRTRPPRPSSPEPLDSSVRLIERRLRPLLPSGFAMNLRPPPIRPMTCEQLREIYLQIHQHSQLLVQSFALARCINPGDRPLQELVPVASQSALMLQAMAISCNQVAEAKIRANSPSFVPQALGATLLAPEQVTTHWHQVQSKWRPWAPVVVRPTIMTVLDVMPLWERGPFFTACSKLATYPVGRGPITSARSAMKERRISKGDSHLSKLPLAVKEEFETLQAVMDPQLEPRYKSQRSLTCGRWTDAEDRVFAAALKRYGYQLTLIQQQFMGNRTEEQLSTRLKNSRRNPSGILYQAKEAIQGPLTDSEISRMWKALRRPRNSSQKWQIVAREVVPRVSPVVLSKMWSAHLKGKRLTALEAGVTWHHVAQAEELDEAPQPEAEAEVEAEAERTQTNSQTEQASTSRQQQRAGGRLHAIANSGRGVGRGQGRGRGRGRRKLVVYGPKRPRGRPPSRTRQACQASAPPLTALGPTDKATADDNAAGEAINKGSEPHSPEAPPHSPASLLLNSIPDNRSPCPHSPSPALQNPSQSAALVEELPDTPPRTAQGRGKGRGVTGTARGRGRRRGSTLETPPRSLGQQVTAFELEELQDSDAEDVPPSLGAKPHGTCSIALDREDVPDNPTSVAASPAPKSPPQRGARDIRSGGCERAIAFASEEIPDSPPPAEGSEELPVPSALLLADSLPKPPPDTQDEIDTAGQIEPRGASAGQISGHWREPSRGPEATRRSRPPVAAETASVSEPAISSPTCHAKIGLKRPNTSERSDLHLSQRPRLACAQSGNIPPDRKVAPNHTDAELQVGEETTRWSPTQDRVILLTVIQDLKQGHLPSDSTYEALAQQLVTSGGPGPRKLAHVKARYDWLKTRFIQHLPSTA